MALALPPKPVPQTLRLHDAAARIVELEPSLDMDEVRTRLCQLVASGALPARSEFQDPADALTWGTEHRRRAGIIGRTFAETWRLWMEAGCPINWAAGTIFVSRTSIRLPWVEWTDVLRLFEAMAQDASAPQQQSTRADIEQKVERWYRDEWIPLAGVADKPPSEPEEMTAARTKFPGVTKLRDLVRATRKKHAPSHWRKPGPRPKKPAT
jgi:hypothetical protein